MTVMVRALHFPSRVPQRTSLKSCVAELYQPLKALRAAILLVIHDELIAEAPSEMAEEVRSMLETDMPEIAARLFPEVPFVVNVRCCKTLGSSR